MWKSLVFNISCEWLLVNCKKANGGSVILLRSLLIAIQIFVVAVLLIYLLNIYYADDWKSIKLISPEKLSWFGAIFVAVYAALYTRFASQWLYLSSVYNSIKQEEVSLHYYCADSMAEWKASFLESAEYLHMVKKSNFAPIIKFWGEDDLVREKYIRYTPGREKRFYNLMSDANKAFEHTNKRFG